MSRGDFARRLIVAAIGIPLALVVLLRGGWLLTAFVGGLAVLATREMNALAENRGVTPFAWMGIPGTLALVFLAGWTRSFTLWAPWAVASLLLLFFLAAAASVRFRGPEDRPLLCVSMTLMGTLYWGGCFAFAIFLRHFPETTGWPDSALPYRGPVLLAFPLAVTWTADTAAYLFGSLFGRRKMIPAVSPGKTVLGGVAGLLAAMIMGAFMGWVFLKLHADFWVAMVLGGFLGLIMGFTTQIGDLIESLFKREAGVKDSGSFLPGHGGVLDRFDALIFTLPITYGLIRLMGLLL
jgi:phosphatidate cytidylyltransferase